MEMQFLTLRILFDLFRKWVGASDFVVENGEMGKKGKKMWI